MSLTLYFEIFNMSLHLLANLISLKKLWTHVFSFPQEVCPWPEGSQETRDWLAGNSRHQRKNLRIEFTITQNQINISSKQTDKVLNCFTYFLNRHRYRKRNDEAPPVLHKYYMYTLIVEPINLRSLAVYIKISREFKNKMLWFTNKLYFEGS